jgi:hypothetical protein
MAIRSLDTMQHHHERFRTNCDLVRSENGRRRWDKVGSRFEFQLGLPQGLLQRSEANNARIQNEITLVSPVYNKQYVAVPKLTISGFQRRRTKGQQGPAADRRRSEARGVGDEGDRCSHDDFLASHFCVCELSGLPILTVIGSCVANTTRGQTIFGTNFFSFQPDRDVARSSFAVSHRFWIYWALSVPLTIVTLASWFWWSRWAEHIRVSRPKADTLRPKHIAP